jgi:hypothetical protein
VNCTNSAGVDLSADQASGGPDPSNSMAPLCANLVLSHNNISMPLRNMLQCVAQYMPNLVFITLNHNRLSWEGELWNPAEFPAGFLGSIYNVDVAYNLIHGSADYFIKRIFWLGQIFFLDVSFNSLCGPLPQISNQFLSIHISGNPVFSQPTGVVPYPDRGGTDVCLRLAENNTVYYCDQTSFLPPPSFIALSSTLQVAHPDLHLSCPLLVGSGLLDLQVDDSYLLYQHCACDSGYARDPTALRCVQCPAHLLCSNVMYKPQHTVATGFFPFPLSVEEYNANSFLLLDALYLPCLPAAVCQPNALTWTPPANDTSSSDTAMATSALSFSCLHGHDPSSLMCSHCLSSYFHYQGVCHACPAGSYWWMAVMITVCACLFTAGTVITLTRMQKLKVLRHARRAASHKLTSAASVRVAAHSESPAPTAAQLDSYALARFGLERLDRSAIVPIVIFWLQAISVLQNTSVSVATSGTTGSNSDISNGDVQASSTNTLGVLGTLLRFSPLAFACMNDQLGWSAEFWFTMAAPLVMVMMFCIVLELPRVTNPLVELLWPSHQRTPEKVAADRQLHRTVAIKFLLLLFSLIYMQV